MTAKSTHLAELYSRLPAGAVAGVYSAADPSVRGAILAHYDGRVLPEELRCAIKTNVDGSSLWAFTQRQDLSTEDIDWIIEQGDVREFRALARHPNLSSEQGFRILSGDAQVRTQLLRHPGMPMALKREIVVSSGDDGVYLDRQLQQELQHPRYMLWAIQSTDRETVLAGYRNVGEVPLAWRWWAGLQATEDLTIGFAELLGITSWGKRIEAVFQKAANTEGVLGRKVAGRRAHQELVAMGRPHILPEQAVVMIAAYDDIEVLAEVDDLPWQRVDGYVSSGRVSAACAMFLLKHPRRPSQLATEIVLHYSEYPTIMQNSTMSERRKALRELDANPSLRRQFILHLTKADIGEQRDYLGDFKLSDIEWMLGEQDNHPHTRQLSDEVLTFLHTSIGPDAQAWRALELLREQQPEWTLTVATVKARSVLKELDEAGQRDQCVSTE